MRADRLVATLLIMQARGRVTAAELSKELEISVATARRDLEALSAAGIPVYPQPGRNGGWQLIGGARIDLSGLTAPEARALFLLLGPAASLDPEAKAALRKLVRALPETFRADAEAAAHAIVLDPAAWGSPERARPPLVNVLQDAVVRRRRVQISYAAWDRDPVERLVDPWGLVEKGGRWYFLGAVHSTGSADGAERTYRVDRISAATVTEEQSVRPRDLDLADAWERVVGAMRAQRAAASALLLVDAAVLPFLRESLGADSVEELTMDAAADAERTRVRVTAPTVPLLARRLAGWAEYLSVVEPDSVRTELARLGAVLTARNGDTQQ
jgi:predicted DNA-binding transcriptional regulator YafY